ncbi:MAG: hypothetical protein OEM79_00455 [Nitrosopumilus sp.]|nr:hypothetical protein [Nitrosopumilus sp.]
MKKSELRLLVAQYREIKNKLKKLPNKKLKEKLGEIEHRYFHETGRVLESEIKEIK